MAEASNRIDKTNFQMLIDFDKFKPASHGFLTSDEVDTIRKNFAIGERTDVELQNLRDFIVLYYSSRTISEKDNFDRLDIMSGICGVIDMEKAQRGLEV